MKKHWLGFLLMMTSISGIEASPLVTPEIPKQFFVKQEWLSLTKTFDVSTEDCKLGTVHRTFFSLLPQYTFYGNDGSLRATATMRFFSLMPVFDVVDAAGNPLGSVQETLSLFFPSFDLVNGNGFILGNAQFNFWETVYTLRDPRDRHVIATLSRAFFRLKDDWTINIVDQDAFYSGVIDLDLFIVVAAFQSDVDSWKTQRAIANSKMTGDIIRNDRNVFETEAEVFHTHGLPEEEIEEAIKRLDFQLSALNIGSGLDEQILAIEQLLIEVELDTVLNPIQKQALITVIRQRLHALRQEARKIEGHLGLVVGA